MRNDNNNNKKNNNNNLQNNKNNNNDNMDTGRGQVGTLAYHGNTDISVHQSLGWCLWHVSETPKSTLFGLQQR